MPIVRRFSMVNRVNSDATQKLIDGITNSFAKDISLADFIGKVSTEIDKAIAQETQQGNAYVGGQFQIQQVNQLTFQCGFSLRFQRPSGDLYELSGQSQPMLLNYFQETDKQTIFNNTPPVCGCQI